MLACIFNLDYDEIPPFCIFNLDYDEIPPFQDLPLSTLRQGLQEFTAEHSCGFAHAPADFVPEDHYIVVGMTAAGTQHACVGTGGK